MNRHMHTWTETNTCIPSYTVKKTFFLHGYNYSLRPDLWEMVAHVEGLNCILTAIHMIDYSVLHPNPKNLVVTLCMICFFCLGVYGISTVFQLFNGDSSPIYVSWTIFPKQALVFTCQRCKSFENTVGKGEIARNE